MDEMLSNLSTYGYIVLFLYSLGGGLVAIIGAGVLSFMGKMDLTTSIAIAFVARCARSREARPSLAGVLVAASVLPCRTGHRPTHAMISPEAPHQ